MVANAQMNDHSLREALPSRAFSGYTVLPIVALRRHGEPYDRCSEQVSERCFAPPLALVECKSRVVRSDPVTVGASGARHRDVPMRPQLTIVRSRLVLSAEDSISRHGSPRSRVTLAWSCYARCACIRLAGPRCSEPIEVATRRAWRRLRGLRARTSVQHTATPARWMPNTPINEPPPRPPCTLPSSRDWLNQFR